MGRSGRLLLEESRSVNWGIGDFLIFRIENVCEECICSQNKGCG